MKRMILSLLPLALLAACSETSVPQYSIRPTTPALLVDRAEQAEIRDAYGDAFPYAGAFHKRGQTTFRCTDGERIALIRQGRGTATLRTTFYGDEPAIRMPAERGERYGSDSVALWIVGREAIKSTNSGDVSCRR